jgi:glycosyltransferase involved in cell wall biosynthesis
MSDMLPKISIVTLSYNQGRFLDDCVKSVLSQKDAGVEYIVVDPGSTDESRQILHDHAKKIDLLILDPDKGPADGLNKGFACATGEIFGYINADDRLAPGSLQFVREYFKAHPEIEVICGAIRIIDEDGKASLRSRNSDLFDVRRYAARLCNIAQQATFFRRSAFDAVGGFNVTNRVAWDGELMADMALANIKFARVRKALGDFRVYQGTISNSNGYLEKLDRYYVGIEGKLINHGIRPYSASARRLGRLLYKANLVRYAECLIVR